MSENKKWFYLKFKENYFDQDEIKVLESSKPNGHIYSLIIIKLYLKSLKFEGQLRVNDAIPYITDQIDLLAGVIGHDPDHVMKAINSAKALGIIEILDTGEMFMSHIHSLIGHSSSEAERIKEYREKIKEKKQKQISYNLCTNVQKRSPEIEREKEQEKKIEREKKEKNTNVQSINNLKIKLLNSLIEKNIITKTIYKNKLLIKDQTKKKEWENLLKIKSSLIDIIKENKEFKTVKGKEKLINLLSNYYWEKYKKGNFNGFSFGLFNTLIADFSLEKRKTKENNSAVTSLTNSFYKDFTNKELSKIKLIKKLWPNKERSIKNQYNKPDEYYEDLIAAVDDFFISRIKNYKKEMDFENSLKLIIPKYNIPKEIMKKDFDEYTKWISSTRLKEQQKGIKKFCTTADAFIFVSDMIDGEIAELKDNKIYFKTDLYKKITEKEFPEKYKIKSPLIIF